MQKTSRCRTCTFSAWIYSPLRQLFILLAASAVLLDVQQSRAQIFPPQGDDTTSSMGVFRITVEPAFRPMMGPAGALVSYTGYQPVDGKLTSPLVIDSATTIGRSGGNTRPYLFPVPVGAGSWDSIAGYGDYALTPALWAGALPPTQEVLTEIKSFILSSVAGTAGQHCPPDPRIPQVPLNWPMVKAGTFAGVSPRSLGIVQENVVNGPGNPDFPAHSFFDIFVEVNLPPIPSTQSGVDFPAGGAILYNDSPLVITNLALTGFPPTVIYIHGETPAVPLKFKFSNPPYWNASDIFGYLVLAGHGTITNDCNSPNGQGPLLDAVLGPIGTSKPELPIEWPRTNILCPSAGTTYDSVRDIDIISFLTNNPTPLRARNFSHKNLTNPIAPPTLGNTAQYIVSNSVVTLEVSTDNGNSWNPVQATGQVVVSIHHTSDSGPTSTFDTEMLQLNLQGNSPLGPFKIRESPTLASTGRHTIRPNAGVFRIGSFFDVFLDLSIDNGVNWNSANRSIRVQPSPPPPPLINLICSTNITVTATSSNGAVVTYTSSVTGGCPPVSLVCNPPSGSTFPIGITTVTCTATDACGQIVTCSFQVTVRAGNPCVVPDNGTGTVTLPPAGCEYLSPNQVHMIINGLPPGTTIELSAIHKDFICKQPGGSVCSFNSVDCHQPGGDLGGEKECADSVLQITLKGTGSLSTFFRQITIPVGFETHVAPRTPGQPVQSFDTEMFRLAGQITGDPDFDLLRITAGNDFGLPSPGHTTLTLRPGGTWEVDSFFDITYRVDFVGHPGGTLGGMSGSTTGTIRMGATPPGGGGIPPIVLNCSTNIVVNETLAAGAVVFFTSTATGGCSPPPTVTCVPPSGSIFPVGTTVVTCTASDTCGSTANCSFKVTVLPEFFNPTNTLPPTNTVYISPALYHLLYSSGIIIRDVRHRFFTQSQPPPALGATVIETFNSQVDFEMSTDGGATFQPVSANAAVTVKVTHTSEGTGGGVYDTEMLSLSLQGLPNGIMIRESPTLASLGKTTVRTIPGGYMIASFFDVFTELSLNGGGTWTPADQEARVELRNDPRTVPPATHPTRLLPPPVDSYISPAKWHALYAQGIVIKDVRHKRFTESLPPPPAGGSNTHSFNSTLDFQVSTDGGQTFQAIRTQSPVQVRVRSLGSGNSGMFDTEMLSLSTTGQVGITSVMLRESPSRPSRGATQIDPQPDGTYRIGSFFDIFPEISIDNGQTWSPTSNGPVRMQLAGQAPEVPASSQNLPMTNSPYVSPAQWHAAYNNGIYISNVTHRGFTESFPPPPLGGNQLEIFNSIVDGQISMNGGPFVPFSATAQVTVNVTSLASLDTGGTRFFDTEMMSLQLSGLPAGVMVRESPSKASTGRTSVRQDSSGGYRIGSFFDIFTDISVDGGNNYLESTNPPATMSPRLPPKKRRFPTPGVPATNSQYVSPKQWHAAYANGYYISNVIHKRFLANLPPPPPRTTNTHNFGSLVTFMIKGPGGVFQPMTANADCQVSVGNSGFQGTERVFQTEMLSLNLSGGSLPPATMIRESPTRRSVGETRFVSGPGGSSQVASFFDIFTELSLDGGTTWSESDTPGFMELHIDQGVPPTTIVQPRIEAGKPTFTVQSQVGLQYLLQYKNNVTDPTWTTISITPGDGQQLTIIDNGATGSARRFYRIEVQEDDNQ